MKIIHEQAVPFFMNTTECGIHKNNLDENEEMVCGTRRSEINCIECLYGEFSDEEKLNTIQKLTEAFDKYGKHTGVLQNNYIKGL